MPTKIILQSVKLKRELPPGFKDMPQLWPWTAVFYNAFLDLVGDRGWEYGPITWHAQRQWARTHGLDPVATRLLHTHLKALDLAFLKWKSDTQKSRDKAAAEESSNGKHA